MNTTRFRKLLWLAPIALTIIAWRPAALRAQAGKSAAPAGGQYNVVKEIMDHKDTLSWKPAGNGIPADVCTILLVCNGTVKVAGAKQARSSHAW